jgi:hypothetical protein
MILVIVLSVAVVALGAYLLVFGWRRRRTPRELRGHWWAEFKREFRAYAARAADGTRRRRRDRESPPG